MNIKFVPYQEQYIDGVSKCLKRNLKSVQDKDEEYIKKKLISPIVNYEWLHEEVLRDISCKRGLVLLANNEVVGFCGAIYSNRYLNSKNVIYVNLTTWAFDKKYCIYVFKAMKLMCNKADIVVDLTPNVSVAEISVKKFQFQDFESKCIRLYPIPYIGEEQIKVHFVLNANEDLDNDLKLEFLNHSFYSMIHVIHFFDKKSREDGIIFYKVFNENDYYIRILKVTNINLFANHVHEIVWKILRRECYNDCVDSTQVICRIMKFMDEKRKVCIECDKRFFGDAEIKYPFFKEVPARRMLLNKTREENIGIPDLLYSEMAILL